MRRHIAIAAALATLAVPALASDRHYRPPQTIGGDGGSASSRATANAHASAASTSRAIANGGAATAAARGGHATGGNAAGGEAYSGGNSQSINARSAPAVFAPSLTTSNDTCAGSSTLGGSGMSFGLIFGTSWEYENCTRRANARQALLNGNPAIAHEIMCEDQGYRRASLRSGQPCAEDRAAAVAPAPVQTVSAPVRPSYCRPLPRNASAADRLNYQRNC